MNDISHFDDTLFAVLKECKTLPVFFDIIFGFLNRRTDFYVISRDPNSPVGLPEGLAEKLVRDKFYHWKHAQTTPEIVIDENVPEAVTETIIETTPMEEISTDFNQMTVNTPQNFTSSESYNGAVHENYSWAQTISEVDIIVNIPENVTTKNLIVTINPQSISIKLKGKDAPVLLEGELCQKCKHLDAIWSLDKRKLEVHLEKCAEIWWDCLLQSEPKLDISKIDPCRPFEELSDEAQAKIEELTWNQERKRMGLPTSDEIKLQEKLRHAWNAEGSPFKGPFDPSAVILQ